MGEFLIKITVRLIVLFLSIGGHFCFSKSEQENNEYYDISEKKLIRGNLYEGINNRLYFLIHKFIHINGNPRYLQVYRKRFSSESVSTEKLAPLLSSVINRESWRQVSHFFYRDKKHVYCSSPFLMDFSILLLKNANPEKLEFFVEDVWKNARILNKPNKYYSNYKVQMFSWHARVDRSYYYACGIIDDVDYDTFEIVIDDNNIGAYSFDKTNFYMNGEVITREAFKKDADLFLASKHQKERLVGEKLRESLNKKTMEVRKE